MLHLEYYHSIDLDAQRKRLFRSGLSAFSFGIMGVSLVFWPIAMGYYAQQISQKSNKTPIIRHEKIEKPNENRLFHCSLSLFTSDYIRNNTIDNEHGPICFQR
jgi:hypothetical protein